MHKIEQRSTEDMYKDIYILELWLELSRKMINKEVKDYPETKTINEAKWKKITSYYFIDGLNHPEMNDDAYKQMIQMTIDASNLPLDKILLSLSCAKKEAEAVYDIPKMKISVTYPSKSNYLSTDDSQRVRRKSGGTSPINICKTRSVLVPTKSTSQSPDIIKIPNNVNVKIG